MKKGLTALQIAKMFNSATVTAEIRMKFIMNNYQKALVAARAF